MQAIFPSLILFVAVLWFSPPGLAQTTAADYHNRGVEKYIQRDFDGAIADYDRGIELNSRKASTYSYRGSAKQAKGELDAAIADYDRAIELNPKDALAYNNRGTAKQAKGDLDAAIADYGRAIELDPEDTGAYYNRGNAKKAKGDLDAAIADYGRAIELNPKFGAPYNSRGLAQMILRRWPEALSDLRRRCELSEVRQDYTRLFIWLVQTRMDEGEAASKDLAACLDNRWRAAPGDWVSKIAGHLLGTVSETDFFAAVVALDPKTNCGQRCEAWFYAGMKKLLAGDKAAAGDYFRKCLATEQKTFVEYGLAEAELKALTP